MAWPDDERDEPPDIIGKLLVLIGETETFELVDAFGGVPLFIATRITENTKVCAVISPASAKILADHFGGLSISLPVAKKWRIKVHWERGLSQPQIARMLGITLRYVAMQVKAMGLKRPPKCSAKVRRAQLADTQATAAPAVIEPSVGIARRRAQSRKAAVA